MFVYIKLYLLMLAAFFALDMLWLGWLARRFYRQHLGYLMASTVNWTAAIVFYLLFVFGILLFVVLPGLEIHTLAQTLARAAAFGLIAYATYDLTNLATVQGWPLLLTVVDMIWGTVLSLWVGAVGYWAGRWLL